MKEFAVQYVGMYVLDCEVDVSYYVQRKYVNKNFTTNSERIPFQYVKAMETSLDYLEEHQQISNFQRNNKRNYILPCALQ